MNNHHLNLTDKFETFDTSECTLNKFDTVVKNGDVIYRNCYNRTYTEKYSKNDYLKEYTLFKTGIDEDEYFKDSIFAVHKEFYHTGNIKLKGIRCRLGFYIGLWYEYNHKGRLVKIIDYDKGYIFNTNDVLNYCVKNNISLNNSNIPSTTIYRHKTSDGKWVWNITYPINNMLFRVISLDGEDGSVLSKKDFQTVE